MRELATNTMTAESRIGSKRAVRGTMRSLLGSKDECRKFRREATAERGCGQELVPASGALRPAQGRQGSPPQQSGGGGSGWGGGARGGAREGAFREDGVTRGKRQ